MLHRRSIASIIMPVAFLGSLLLGSSPANATVFTVEAGPNNTNTFSPNIIYAEPGDTVTWKWNPTFQQPGQHTVTGWTGDPGFTSFNSPNLSANNPTYTQTYNGGTIYYRCLFNSFLNQPNYEGVCIGMCGVITNIRPTQPPAVPTITGPASGSSTSTQPIVFTGTGTPWSTVFIYNAGTNAVVTRVVVPADGNFRVQSIMPVGSYSVFARAWWAFDSSQPTLASAYGNTVSFTVTPNGDTIAPGGRVTTPDFSVFVGNPTIEGVAWDNVGVKEIRVYFRSARGIFFDPYLVATCLDCPGPGNNQFVRWKVTHEFLHSYLMQSTQDGFLDYGVYQVNIRTIDTSGNISNNPAFSNTVTFIATPTGRT